MKYTLRLLALVSFACTISINALASTLLWESLEVNAGGTWGGGIASSIVGMQFFFGYDLNRNSFPANEVSYETGTYLRVDEQAIEHLIGGNRFFVQGETGSFDFDVTTSPAFAEVSAVLTNGVDDTVYFGAFGYNRARLMTGGTAYSGLENNQWTYLRPNQTQKQLFGASIDYFRLTVSEVSWGTTGGGFSILGTGKWQVYGTAVPVPEPKTYALMLAGLGLMALVARRRKR